MKLGSPIKVGASDQDCMVSGIRLAYTHLPQWQKMGWICIILYLFYLLTSDTSLLHQLTST
ncbi:hypothetical protein NQ486_16625 [Phocaeicola dorei]|nr:hypothetical protein [Phocaeicola dorei]UWN81433.1 hypothetical protein NQ486_16625 [Phocaeicola dorei]